MNLKKLYKIATNLDKQGRYEEADVVTDLMTKIAQYDWKFEEPAQDSQSIVASAVGEANIAAKYSIRALAAAMEASDVMKGTSGTKEAASESHRAYKMAWSAAEAWNRTNN